jgi:hypothetical protein
VSDQPLLYLLYEISTKEVLNPSKGIDINFASAELYRENVCFGGQFSGTARDFYKVSLLPMNNMKDHSF